jgi:hypothetical protein
VESNWVRRADIIRLHGACAERHPQMSALSFAGEVATHH